MNIEKISSRKIKCILTQEDLESRDLRLEELAYGTEKVHALFEEMLSQAHDRFGFEYRDTPIAIEAVPAAQGEVILIISQMVNFDELDTRFSRFSEGAEDIFDREDSIENMLEATSDFVDEPLLKTKSEKSGTASVEEVDLTRVYTFKSLEDLVEVSQILHGFYNGVNSLYKEPDTGIYYLIIHKTFHTTEEFGKTCNILSEYGHKLADAVSRAGYCEEHFPCIAKKSALQRLYLF